MAHSEWEMSAFEDWLSGRVYEGGRMVGRRYFMAFTVKRDFTGTGRSAKAWWSDAAVEKYGERLHEAAHAWQAAGGREERPHVFELLVSLREALVSNSLCYPDVETIARVPALWGRPALSTKPRETRARVAARVVVDLTAHGPRAEEFPAALRDLLAKVSKTPADRAMAFLEIVQEVYGS